MVFKNSTDCKTKLTSMAKLYNIDLDEYCIETNGELYFGRPLGEHWFDMSTVGKLQGSHSGSLVCHRFKGRVSRTDWATPEELLKAAQEIRNGARFIQKLNKSSVTYFKNN